MVPVLSSLGDPRIAMIDKVMVYVPVTPRCSPRS
ncbi:hypothetical protein YPC_4037 [Yersinia pestis biovar Medievalis str. Harbin 35]|nr:hypothetical protein YPC_4037 [Yersinia pestis biovar Medievalis str. Harbin 35]EEO78182.1 hypothetical protein YP516_0406 [Yersinia pestis Nepal516]EEO82857.1 hypothetical protein YPF_0833 [Yersinia pestis biovar Orientalis str. India 195]EEO86826.1 hypothetical protein YPH_2750 [Yersinia pestis biovar Orientalis str. PEXU2]EEO91842.1 hypothetical protein YPS_0788 [Yersinia pestis Pestoides A]